MCHILSTNQTATKRLFLLLSSKLLKKLAALLAVLVLNALLVLLETVLSVERDVVAPTTNVAPLPLPLDLALKLMDLPPLEKHAVLAALVEAVDLADPVTTTDPAALALIPPLLVLKVLPPIPTTLVTVDLADLVLLVETVNNIAAKDLAEKANNTADLVEMANNNTAARDLAMVPLVEAVDPADPATMVLALLPLVPAPLALPLLNKRCACY